MCGRHVIHTRPVADMASLLHRKSTSTNSNGTRFEAAAETSTEALEIQQSIEAEAIATIKDAGLTLPEYMQILSLASQDEAFQDKVLGRMDESTDER